MERLVMFREGDTLTIKVNGPLDYVLHMDFRNGYEHMPDSIERYVIDLANATHIDSSAMGMLLLLRDHIGGDRKRVYLANAHDTVLQTLRTANFESLFNIL